MTLSNEAIRRMKPDPPSSLRLKCQNLRRFERFLIIQVRFSTRGVRLLLPRCSYNLGSPRFLLVSIGKPWNRIPHYSRGCRVVLHWIRIVSELPIGPTESRAKALIPLCRTKLEHGNNPVPMEICSTASGIVRNPIPGFSNRNRQQPW
ncbi:hypothetical protein E3N88_23386 [Mikania micrantha]|uniref:Uncharacterized protein n=1 Tax=Mikania micrantha TaxID=192012 RepID=A0A5N6NFQ5_9ASTR|nr:hypothetical protein E3N88_23386 [Mikania micrantha]